MGHPFRAESRDTRHPLICTSEHAAGRGCGEQVEAVEQAAISGLRAGESGSAVLGDNDEALGSASALGRGTAIAEGDQTLVLHAMQRGVERTGGGISASLRRDFGEDGDAVSFLAKPQDGQQYDLLEFAQGAFGIHMNYNVVVKGETVKWKCERRKTKADPLRE